MNKIFRFQAYTRDERYLAIESIEKVIHDFRGFIVDHHMYSDMQISMYVEMKECRILNFYHRLRKVVKLSRLDLNQFDPHSRETCRVYINVNFVKATGNLQLSIPDVPG
jgi:hypothetical protein